MRFLLAGCITAVVGLSLGLSPALAATGAPARGAPVLAATTAPAVPAVSDGALGESTGALGELASHYHLFRNVALGLGAVGFLTGVGGMALNRDHPEAYLQWRRVLALCTAVFLLAAVDRTVGQGVARIIGAGDPPIWALWR